MSIPEISVHELALRLADHDPNLQLIDVREPEEVAMAFVANFTILPLSQYQEWSPTIASQFNPQALPIDYGSSVCLLQWTGL